MWQKIKGILTLNSVIKFMLLPEFSFYRKCSQESCCCCRDTGSVVPHGSQHWEVTAVISLTEDHRCKMVTSLLATAFPNFSSLCSSPPSENTDVGGCLHYRGGDTSKAAVGTDSWEEFSVYKKSTSGACLVLSPLPSAGVSYLRVLTNGKSVVMAMLLIMCKSLLWIWKLLAFPKLFFFFFSQIFTRVKSVLVRECLTALLGG